MRGLYAGYAPVKGARCRVVLSLEEDFAPHLVETLLAMDGGNDLSLTRTANPGQFLLTR
jgi:purine nucleosidase